MKWASAAVLAILIIASAQSWAAGDDVQPPESIKLGEFVPSSLPFPAPAVSLTDAAGSTVRLADFRGKLIVLNLWATWCAPCLREMPSLERLQSRLGDRAVVLAVSEDRGGNKAVEPFVAKLGLKAVKIYIDPNSQVGRAFDVQGLPTSLVIDRDGKVLGRVEGAAEWDSPKLLGVLEPLVSADGVVKTSSH
jgi:thiol-disulfide isomerase/thioredoxin